MPANIIFSIEISDEVFASFECSNGAILSEGCRVGGGVALNLGHGLGNRFWSGGIADTPTRHGIGLGETVNGDGEIIQVFAEGCDAGVLGVAIDKVLVNFIGEDDDVLIKGNVTEGTKLVCSVD